MRIVVAESPNFELLDRLFNIRGKPVYIAYGDIIYNPQGVEITSWIKAHEEAHGERQRRMGVEEWWAKYVEDVEFRLDEELVGHKAEYGAWKGILGKDRGRLHRALEMVAVKLASPMYGSLITPTRARALLLS